MNSSVKPTKQLQRMTKAELIQELRALEKKAARTLSQFPDQLVHTVHELEVHQVELEMQNRELLESQLLLEESRSRYADLYDFAPVGYVTLDRTGRIQDINLTGAALLGVERSLLAGIPLSNYVAPADRRRFLQYIANCQAEDGRLFIEIELRTKLGESRVIELRTVPVPDAELNTTLYRTALTDVTDRKRADESLRQSEERLLQAQKMEAVGRLAGGVAHDFNNLLTAIIGYCQLAERRLERGEVPQQELTGIGAAAQSAAVLTRQLLAFGRKQALQPKVLHLNTLIGGMDEMLRRLIGEDVELVTRLEPSLWRIRADAGQIEQVIMNLVVNARDAMPEGGRVFIQTFNRVVDESGTPGDPPAGSYVMLTARDTGTGMTPETMSRIFEPFFTTKERGKGTGLGLATVYGIVRQMNGHISVESQPGAGTIFKILMPRTLESETESPHLDESPARASGGDETILLVEDQASVRAIVAQTLRARGYNVLEASNGEEALTLFAKDIELRPHLLVTDVIMPKMGGAELAARLSTRIPMLRTLYMSGYAGDAMGDLAPLNFDTWFIEKPFTPDSIVRKVREVLDASVP